MTLSKIMIAVAVGMISVFISILQWETFSPPEIGDPRELFWALWLYLNVFPIAIGFFVKHYGHEINLFVYYLTVFLQWVLFTLLIFKLKRLIRKKRFPDNQA
jgi:hypothetical protein